MAYRILYIASYIFLEIVFIRQLSYLEQRRIGGGSSNLLKYTFVITIPVEKIDFNFWHLSIRS